MPDGVAIYAAPIVMAAIGFAICAQKNSIEIVATGEITKRKMIFVGIISLLGLYMVLHTTSAVFLYFNF